MGIINRENTFIGNTDAKASEVNADFDKLYNEINGYLDENNIDFNRTELKNALLNALRDVDGAGSNLNADQLDGKEYSEISSEIDTKAGAAETEAKSYADQVEIDANGYTDTHEAKANPHSESVSDTDLSNHTGNTSAHHTKYTNSEAVSAVNAESSLSVNITGSASSASTATNADKVDGYHIQKNGTDGSGTINFKT